MARTKTPLSFSTHSELRLGEHGNPRSALLKARAAGVTVTLSSDATSIAPPNMFENMRFTPGTTMEFAQKGTDTNTCRRSAFTKSIKMATINSARAAQA